jgi:hypothetical protein
MEDETLFCPDCAAMYFYRLPKYNVVEKKLGSKCDCCGKRDVVFKRRDLVPGWQDEN